ncbi:MAG: DUF4230 domain-containing protein [Anaerolineae bacterium]|nr:DUF4230 domain-containing protein [Anaerolineae bacterium]
MGKEKESASSNTFVEGCMRAIGNVFGKVLGWVIIGLLLGGGLYIAVDMLIGRPAAYFCNATGLCSVARLPVPKNVYVPTVERVQALSQLTTTRYNYANIITGQTDIPSFLNRLYGESLVMVAVVHINAGIDIGEITEEDIVYDEVNDMVTITLPAPTLQDCFLDEGQSYIADRSSGIFAQPSTDLDTATRRFALAQFRDQALEEGILTDAALEAQAVVSEFFAVASDIDITVIVEPINPDAPLPETCS